MTVEYLAGLLLGALAAGSSLYAGLWWSARHPRRVLRNDGAAPWFRNTRHPFVPGPRLVSLCGTCGGRYGSAAHPREAS